MSQNKNAIVFAVIAFCVGLAVSFFTLPLWVASFINVSREGNRSDWLGFVGSVAGNFITGVVAATAIYFAWLGIRQQLRIGIIGREEERIEKVLPGLREAVGYIQDLRRRLRTISAHSVISIIHQFNDFDPENDDEFDACVKSRLSGTDPETSQRILLVLQTILHHAGHANADQQRLQAILSSPQHSRELEANMIGEARQRARVAQTGANLKMMAVQAALQNLKQLETDLVRRVEIFEARLPRFRTEIERYFDG